MFDGNAYAKDTRKDFMNWSMWAPGAFDYAADKLGLTYGATAELNQKQWALRGGYFLIAGGIEFEQFRHAGFPTRQLCGRTGDALFGCSRSRANCAPSAGSTARTSGSYRETLNNPALNLDIAQTRTGRIKYGYVVSLEQALTDDIGLFGRWSWNDGKTEIMAFTDIDASACRWAPRSRASKWGRPDDVIGIGGAINALSHDHRDFIAAGGLGALIGDGALNYRQERILETYYAYALTKQFTLTGGLPVHHQSRLQCRPRPGPCLLGEAARGILIPMPYFVVKRAL